MAEFDVYRGLGILLVILGHIDSFPAFPKAVIYAFHMPAFFLLSGALFNVEKNLQYELRDFVWIRVSRLYLPSLAIGAACAVMAVVLGKVDGINDFLLRTFGVIYSIPKFEWTFYCSPIWFLSCLLCVEVMYLSIHKYARNFVLVYVLTALSLGVALGKLVHFYSPLNIHTALTAMFFFFIGNQLRLNGLLNRRFDRLTWLVGTVSLLLLATYVNPTSVDLSKNQIGDLNFFVVGALCGSYSLYRLALALSESKLLSLFGANTIVILGFNYWVCELVDRGLGKFSITPESFPNCYWCMNFAFQLLFYYIAILLLNRLPLLNSVLQGKR